jgi:hypothetical protein
MHIFENIHKIKEKTEEILIDFNNYHPHDGLSNMSPVKFFRTKYKIKMPNFSLKEKGGPL